MLAHPRSVVSHSWASRPSIRSSDVMAHARSHRRSRVMVSAALEPISALGVSGFDRHRLERQIPIALPADIVEQEVWALGPQECSEAAIKLIYRRDHCLREQSGEGTMGQRSAFVGIMPLTPDEADRRLPIRPPAAHRPGPRRARSLWPGRANPWTGTWPESPSPSGAEVVRRGIDLQGRRPPVALNPRSVRGP